MDLITKITAPNPGVFTGGGTNTYLIGKDDITLVDPGPNISEHLDEIIKAGDGKIKRIFVTHTHKDHSPAALPLSKTLNVPMYGRLVDGESSWEDETFIPEIILNDKDIIELIKNVESDITVGRVLVRPSGTENKIRVMVEAPEEKVATKYAKDIISAIQAKL